MNLVTFKGLHFTPVLLRATDSWLGSRGYVQDIMIQNLKSIKNVKIYSCGSNEMIQAAKSKLSYSGLSEKNFYFDAFVATN